MREWQIPGRATSRPRHQGRGLLVLAVCAALSVATPLQAQPANVQIQGPGTALPGEFVEFVVTWEGGTPPWTVVFDATDVAGFDHQMQFVAPNEAYCTNAGFDPGCGTSPFFLSLGIPQIADITATVTDDLGASAEANPLRMRVGTDETFYVTNMPTVDIRPDPGDPSRYLCLGGPNDVPLMDVYGDPLAPTFDVTSDPRVADPAYLRVFASEATGVPIGVVYGIADMNYVDETFPDPLTDVLSFPVEYGDYSAPMTVPWDSPMNPSPGVEQSKRYSVGVPRPPQCNGGFQTRFFDFYVNPPQAGAVVIGTDDEEGAIIDGTTVSADVLTLFTGRRRVEARQAYLGCLDEAFEAIALTVVSVTETTIAHTAVADPQEALVYWILEFAEEPFEQECRELAGLPPAKSAKGSAPAPILDLILEAGVGEIEVVEAIQVDLQATYAAVSVQGPFAFFAGQVVDGPSLFQAKDEEITVVPLDASHPAVVLAPGFFVQVDASGPSEPISQQVFADGFE